MHWITFCKWRRFSLHPQFMKLTATALCALFIVSATFSQTRVTLASLRTGTVSTSQNYFVTDPGREGIFYYDAKDVTSVDNGGTVIVNAGRRYKRMYSGFLDARW